jgi:3-carboxy-cis,cis-muconate cycloisomerase
MLDGLFTTDALRDALSERARLQGLLDFEAALARASARTGVIPAEAALPIAAACRAALYDLDELARATAIAGNPAIPVVQALTARAGAAGRWVHFGATSQDAIDTGTMLQLRAALALVDADLARAARAAARLARAHAATPIAGRTLLQHAEPTTFGLKAAGWLDALLRDRERLAQFRARGLAVQLGGAVGDLAALGPATAAALAEELGLACPRLPWHAARDRVAEAATVLGLLVGTLGKIGRDVALLMQTEVGEAREPSPGGSSAMPQKRNPVAAAILCAAATRVPALVASLLGAMVGEHERSVGAWHAEWQVLPEICALAGGALARAAALLEGLELDPGRMRANLDATLGQIHAGAVARALAARLGARAAHERVADACRRASAERRPLRELLEGELPADELDRLFDPARAAAAAAPLIARVVSEREEEP